MGKEKREFVQDFRGQKEKKKSEGFDIKGGNLGRRG